MLCKNSYLVRVLDNKNVIALLFLLFLIIDTSEVLEHLLNKLNGAVYEFVT